ncbi:MAG: hypothetical protein ACK5Q5_18605 [Planctomycetaceae bacterium]
MAKRKATRGEFNMSAAIRDQLQANPKLSLRECMEAVATAHSTDKINPNSFGVAFSNQRRRLGIKGRRGGRRVRVMKPGAVGRPAANSNKPVRMEHLQAARRFMAEVGDAETAVAAVRALAQLQIG